MTKFIPSLTQGKTYELSLIAINQQGNRCDLIYSYVDDDGDEMFLREFTETFVFRMNRTAIWNHGHCVEELHRDVKIRGAYRHYDSLYKRTVLATLALNYNPSTQHYYTVITARKGSGLHYSLPVERPDFWLTDEVFYGLEGLAELDRRHQKALYMANRELEERADVYESGRYQYDMEEILAEHGV